VRRKFRSKRGKPLKIEVNGSSLSLTWWIKDGDANQMFGLAFKHETPETDENSPRFPRPGPGAFKYAFPGIKFEAVRVSINTLSELLTDCDLLYSLGGREHSLSVSEEFTLRPGQL
jgi:hypothetical protein